MRLQTVEKVEQNSRDECKEGFFFYNIDWLSCVEERLAQSKRICGFSSCPQECSRWEGKVGCIATAAHSCTHRSEKSLASSFLSLEEIDTAAVRRRRVNVILPLAHTKEPFCYNTLTHYLHAHSDSSPFHYDGRRRLSALIRYFLSPFST